jgi:hypothetical protein
MRIMHVKGKCEEESNAFFDRDRMTRRRNCKENKIRGKASRFGGEMNEGGSGTEDGKESEVIDSEEKSTL